jgi:hypothetical protein
LPTGYISQCGHTSYQISSSSDLESFRDATGENIGMVKRAVFVKMDTVQTCELTTGRLLVPPRFYFDVADIVGSTLNAIDELFEHDSERRLGVYKAMSAALEERIKRTVGLIEDEEDSERLSKPVNAASVRVLNSIIQAHVPEESYFRDYDDEGA